MITELGRLLGDEHSGHPQNLLERARRPGRSMGSLARVLEDYFTEQGLALPTDQADRLDAGRRTDHTIETALAIVRDLARFLADRRGKQD
jgi:hypothetical protein